MPACRTQSRYELPQGEEETHLALCPRGTETHLDLRPRETETHLELRPRVTKHTDRFLVPGGNVSVEVPVPVLEVGFDRSTCTEFVDEGHEVMEAAIGHGLLGQREEPTDICFEEREAS